MKKCFVANAVLLFILFIIFSSPAYAVDLTAGNTQVFFSPRGGCTEAIIKEIDQAKSAVFVQAYSFTSAPIAKALLNAHKRGVKVQAIQDRRGLCGKSAGRLL